MRSTQFERIVSTVRWTMHFTRMRSLSFIVGKSARPNLRLRAAGSDVGQFNASCLKPRKSHKILRFNGRCSFQGNQPMRAGSRARGKDVARSIVSLAALALFLGAGSAALAAEPDGPARLVTAEEAYQIKLHQALTAAIDGGTGTARVGEDGRNALRDFYDKRDGKPFWTAGGKLTPAALSAIAAISKAGDYALRASDYPVPPASLGGGGTPATLEELASAEIKLGLAALAYAHDAHVGKISPEEVGNTIDRGSTPPNPGKVLAAQEICGAAQRPAGARDPRGA
jgi:hypothetical protein